MGAAPGRQRHGEREVSTNAAQKGSILKKVIRENTTHRPIEKKGSEIYLAVKVKSKRHENTNSKISFLSESQRNDGTREQTKTFFDTPAKKP